MGHHQGHDSTKGVVNLQQHWPNVGAQSERVVGQCSAQSNDTQHYHHDQPTQSMIRIKVVGLPREILVYVDGQESDGGTDYPSYLAAQMVLHSLLVIDGFVVVSIEQCDCLWKHQQELEKIDRSDKDPR